MWSPWTTLGVGPCEARTWPLRWRKRRLSRAKGRPSPADRGRAWGRSLRRSPRRFIKFINCRNQDRENRESVGGGGDRQNDEHVHLVAVEETGDRIERGEGAGERRQGDGLRGILRAQRHVEPQPTADHEGQKRL